MAYSLEDLESDVWTAVWVIAAVSVVVFLLPRCGVI